MTWHAGTITCARKFPSQKTILFPYTTLFRSGGNRILNLAGTTTWSGATGVNNNAIQFIGGTINNSGTWNNANTFSTYFNTCSGTKAFNNTGDYNKQGNTLTTVQIAFNSGAAA